MKNFLFLCVALFLCFPSSAQDRNKRKSKYYISSEVGAGNYMTYGVDLNYILSDRYTFRLGYSGYVRNSKEKPEDLIQSISTPHDIMNTFQFMVGHAIYFNRDTKKNRINLAAGIGYTSINKPTNWRAVNTENLNVYTYDTTKEQEASLIIQPKIEFLIERYFGFTVSPTIQISESETYIGIGFGSMLGNIK